MNAKGSRDVISNRFTVPIRDCDVEDKENLHAFRELWTKWMTWYESTPDEPHSIERQIQLMIWNDLTYRTVMSTRSEKEAELASQNQTLSYLLDNGFVASQVLAICRLVDRDSQVISLFRLLKNIQKHRRKITREAYVSGTGYPYEPSDWPDETNPNDPMTGMWGLETPGLRNWLMAEELHKSFDRLTGTAPDRRQRKDIIPDKLFKTIEHWLTSAAIDKINDLRNNFLAHAADSQKRKGVIRQGVTFQQLDEAQKIIVRIERVLTDELLSIRIARDAVPIPPLNMYKNLDSPFSTAGGIKKMRERWEQLAKERNTWVRGALGELLKGQAKNK